MPFASDIFLHAPVRISYKQQEFIPPALGANAFHYNLTAGTTANIEIRLRQDDNHNSMTERRTAYDYWNGVPPGPENALQDSWYQDQSTWTIHDTPFTYQKIDQQCVYVPAIVSGSAVYPSKPYGEFFDHDTSLGWLLCNWPKTSAASGVWLSSAGFFINCAYMLWAIERILMAHRLPFNADYLFNVSGSDLYIPASKFIAPLGPIECVRVTLTTIGPSTGTLTGNPEVFKAGQIAFGYF